MIGRQAVVVGAAMAGLTAARVLADHFERVVVLDGDVLPRERADRAGVPQGKHVHILLAGGQRALGDLLPGFERRLAETGAVPLRVGLDLRMERPGYDPFPQRDLGLDAYACPPGLEQFLAYGAALTKLAARDPAVHALVAEVQHLLRPRSAYQDPDLVSKVLAVMAEG